MKKIVLLFLLLIPFSLFAEPEWISTSVSDEEDVIEIDIRDTEIIYDMDGNVLSQDETTYNYFKWFINTGDTFDGYHIQVAEGYYYPYNRGMFIGWS